VYKIQKKKYRVWFASKILTLQQIINDNMYHTYPFEEIISENETEYKNNSNYQYYLIHSTKSECEINYKKCGILDSMNNIMCIPNSEICPLNEIKTSLNENSNIYETGNYFDYDLFYTNQNINNRIITNITISDEQPKYITVDNFIFDDKTYYDEKIDLSVSGYHGSGSSFDDGGGGGGGSGGGGGGIGDGYGGWRNLLSILDVDYGNSDQELYILEKFNETINVDLHYQKIDNNLYYRNYIGFENNEQMEEFINTDFWNNYRVKFPNIYLIIVGFISTLPLMGIIIFAIVRLNYQDRPYSRPPDRCCVICSKITVIFFYSFFFLLYYIICLIKYCDLHEAKINCNSLKKIKSEIIIEDFIKSFCSEYNFKNKFYITEIVLLTISGFIFIIGWILHIIIQRAIDLGKLI